LDRSRPQLLRSVETLTVGHSTCGNQWALWRRSGGDRRIRRTGTGEGVLCERWDSRLGSVRHVPTLQGSDERVNEWRSQIGCNNWISWGNNNSVSCRPLAETRRGWMEKFEGLTCSISCRIHVKAVTPTGIAFWMRIISPLHCVFHPLAECSKRPSSKAAGESKPEAYPHGYVEDFDEPRTKLAGFFSILPR
jgi:hypothetical protein